MSVSEYEDVLATVEDITDEFILGMMRYAKVQAQQMDEGESVATLTLLIYGCYLGVVGQLVSSISPQMTLLLETIHPGLAELVREHQQVAEQEIVKKAPLRDFLNIHGLEP